MMMMTTVLSRLCDDDSARFNPHHQQDSDDNDDSDNGDNPVNFLWHKKNIYLYRL